MLKGPTVILLDSALFPTAGHVFVLRNKSPFLTCLIVVPIVLQLVRRGDLSTVAWSRGDFWCLRWLPDGNWARALAIGLVVVVLGTLVIAALLLLFDIESKAGSTFVWFKAAYAAVLVAFITPLLALASLGDVSMADDD